MFTKKKLTGDHLPSTLNALVLRQRRTLILFYQYLLNILLNSFFHLSKIWNIISEKTFSMHKIPFYIKQFFPYDIKNLPNDFHVKLSFITEQHNFNSFCISFHFFPINIYYINYLSIYLSIYLIYLSIYFIYIYKIDL